MLSALESQVATLFADAVLYGLYIATLIHCLWRLLYGHNGWKTSHHVDWPILIMSIAIFLSTTLDTALSVRRAMLGLRQVSGGPTPNLVWSDTTMVCEGTVLTYITSPEAKHSGDPHSFTDPFCRCSFGTNRIIVNCCYFCCLICSLDVPLLDRLCKIKARNRSARHSLDSRLCLHGTSGLFAVESSVPCPVDTAHHHPFLGLQYSIESVRHV